MIVPFPSGGPTDVLGRMLAQGRPELKDKLAALGLDAGGGKPLELAASVRAETVRRAEVIHLMRQNGQFSGYKMICTKSEELLLSAFPAATLTRRS